MHDVFFKLELGEKELLVKAYHSEVLTPAESANLDRVYVRIAELVLAANAERRRLYGYESQVYVFDGAATASKNVNQQRIS